MHKYFGLVVLVIVSSVVVSAKDETAYGCISYSFTCCTNVNYQVEVFYIDFPSPVPGIQRYSSNHGYNYMLSS